MSKDFRNSNGNSQGNDQDANIFASIEAIEEAIKRELSDTDDKESNMTQEVKKENLWKKTICQKANQVKKPFGKIGTNIKMKENSPREPLQGGIKEKVYQSKFMSTIRAQKAEKFLAAAAVSVVLMAALVSVSFSTCYEVLLDGESVCYVDNTAELDSVLNDLKDQANAASKVDLENAELSTDVKVEAKHKLFVDTASKEELNEILADKVAWQVPGASIVVGEGDDKTVLAFASLEDAQAVLDTLTQKAIDENADAEILGTSFYETLTVAEANVDADEILTQEEALDVIAAGKEAVKIHTITSGESLWSIAIDNNTSVSTLNELNPGLREDRLQIGQEIKLNKIEPLINVVVDKVVTVAEAIPYGETVKESSSLLKGETEVVTQGVEGSKDVTYQISEYNGTTLEKVVLSEVVTKEPVNKVVNKGTAVVASSSRSGTGALNWPTSGSITSPYGYRSSGFHTGIDIANKKGTTVVAAAGGTVASAGWSGSYGYCIIVDHGNGMKTRYAHLSKINCSVGQTVLRGEKIGEVGSTGNSTGPHLHFEVIINGSSKNPINYLK